MHLASFLNITSNLPFNCSFGRLTNLFLLVYAMYIGMKLLNHRIDFMFSFGRYSSFPESLIPLVLLKAMHESPNCSTYLVSTF